MNSSENNSGILLFADALDRVRQSWVSVVQTSTRLGVEKSINACVALQDAMEVASKAAPDFMTISRYVLDNFDQRSDTRAERQVAYDDFMSSIDGRNAPHGLLEMIARYARKGDITQEERDEFVITLETASEGFDKMCDAIQDWSAKTDRVLTALADTHARWSATGEAPTTELLDQTRAGRLSLSIAHALPQVASSACRRQMPQK